MSTSIEAQIIQLHLRHFREDSITAMLGSGTPESTISDKPGSFQNHSIPATNLADEIAKELGVPIS
jgi:hypothetical protein